MYTYELNIYPELTYKGKLEPTKNYIVALGSSTSSWTFATTPKKQRLPAGIGYNLLILEGVSANYYVGIKAKTIELAVDPGSSGCSIDPILAQTYSGEEIKPDVVLRIGKEQIQQTYPAKTISYPLSVADSVNYESRFLSAYDAYEAYTVSYEDNVDAGTAVVWVNPRKEHTKHTRLSSAFTINPYSMSGQLVEVSGVSGQVNYTGSKVTMPSLSVLFNGKRLLPDIDYNVSYQSNVDIGNASLVLSGIKNFSGTRSIQYKIVGDLSKAIVCDKQTGCLLADGKEYDYTGSIVLPQIDLYISQMKLVVGTHYSIMQPSSPVLPGVYSIQMDSIPSGNCINSIAFQYKVIGDISNASISGASLLYSKTGQEIKPSIELTRYGVKLTAGTDYSISYPSIDYVNKGLKKIIFTGIGCYRGSIEYEYSIYDNSTTLLVTNDNQYIQINDQTSLTRSALISALTAVDTSYTIDSIKVIVVGSSIATIENSLFANCVNLVEVDMSPCSRDVEVPESCFDGCTSLRSFKFPST